MSCVVFAEMVGECLWRWRVSCLVFSGDGGRCVCGDGGCRV